MSLDSLNRLTTNRFAAIRSFAEKIDELDEKSGHFIGIYEGWISSFPSNIESIILCMVSSFSYYTHKMSNKALEYLHDKLMQETGFKSSDFLYTYLKKGNGAINSSIEYMIEYKHINGLNKAYFVDDIDQLEQYQWEQVERIVIVDDICGSGESLITYLEEQDRDFTNKIIYYLVIHAMENGINKLDEYQTAKDFTIRVISINLRRKAFDELELTNDDRTMLYEYSKAMSINDDYILGWKSSESLIAFSNNTPNNTIGLFWYDTDKYKAPFSRNEKAHPLWRNRPSMKELKSRQKNRTESNYYAVQRSREF